MRYLPAQICDWPTAVSTLALLDSRTEQHSRVKLQVDTKFPINSAVTVRTEEAAWLLDPRKMDRNVIRRCDILRLRGSDGRSLFRSQRFSIQMNPNAFAGRTATRRDRLLLSQMSSGGSTPLRECSDQIGLQLMQSSFALVFSAGWLIRSTIVDRCYPRIVRDTAGLIFLSELFELCMTQK